MSKREPIDVKDHDIKACDDNYTMQRIMSTWFLLQKEPLRILDFSEDKELIEKCYKGLIDNITP